MDQIKSDYNDENNNNNPPSYKMNSSRSRVNPTQIPEYFYFIKFK
jgi:hypothetical protein